MDALEMLGAMRKCLVRYTPKNIQYTFEYTDMWDHVSHFAGDLRSDSINHYDTILFDKLMDEIRIRGNEYDNIRQALMLRFFALQESRRQGMVVTSETLKETADAFRREEGLVNSEDLHNWLNKNDLSDKEFLKLMEEETRLRWITTLAEPEIPDHLINYLRTTNRYHPLMRRIKDKQHILQERFMNDLSLEDIKLKEEQLLEWYFTQFLKRPMIKDIKKYSRSVGFENEDALRRVILYEYYYSNLKGRNE